MSLKKTSIFIAFIISWFLYALYSYSQVDPNLVLLKNKTYWNFQQKMWKLGYHDRERSSMYFGILMVLVYSGYFYSLKYFSRKEKTVFFSIISAIMFLSYPALSHDVFNYMFNAKMVMKYNLNPHTHVALEISSDDWLRFMHNTHTAAPYGYGWTVLSLIPYAAGSGKFLFTLLLFRSFMVVGFGGLIVSLYHILKKNTQSFDALFPLILNPLLFIEVIGNMHNDVWMMLFALLSVVFVVKMNEQKKKNLGVPLLLSFVFLLLSSSIKYATLVLGPVVLLMVFASMWRKRVPLLTKLAEFWPEISAVFLFVPLFTARSQQFHPWYLVWSLSFLPLIKNSYIRMFLSSFSVSSMFRYIPYLMQGNYTDQVLLQQKLITWVGGMVLFSLFVLLRKVNSAYISDSNLSEY